MSFDIVGLPVHRYICAKMKPISKFYEVLYVSTLAPTFPVNVVANIAARARTLNGEQNITGLLIFDGMRFCQQIEGSEKEVLAGIERISKDIRHTNVTIFHHGPLAERRFKSFSLAFTNTDDIEALSKMEKLDGQAGVTAFIDLLTTLELEGHPESFRFEAKTSEALWA